MNMRRLVIALVILVCVVNSLLVLFLYTNRQQATVSITSFEECINAGFPQLESYPPLCKTTDGKSFTQDIGNELTYKDEMLIESPRPQTQIISPAIIKGRARGFWFFEGQLNAELVDANKRSIGKAVLTAEGEWMTEDFVPFIGEMTYTKTTENGSLYIRNDNPSGLSENQKELRIPVKL